MSIRATTHLTTDVADETDSFLVIEKRLDGITEEEIEERRTSWMFHECLNQCPASTRTALQQMIQEGVLWTDKKIAEVAGIARSTYYRNIARAKKKAKKLLAEKIKNGEI